MKSNIHRIVLVSSGTDHCGRLLRSWSQKDPIFPALIWKSDIHRFDRQLFTMDQDTMAEAIDYFYRWYGDFFDVFSYYIINIGSPSQRDYPGNLALFINDPLNREVYKMTQDVFGDLSDLEKRLNRCL